MPEAIDLQIRGVADLADIRERLVLSPCSGRFHPHPPETFTTEGEWVSRGQVLGEVHDGVQAVPVVSAFEGWVMGMLSLDGAPVAGGDALFWIRT